MNIGERWLWTYSDYKQKFALIMQITNISSSTVIGRCVQIIHTNDNRDYVGRLLIFMTKCSVEMANNYNCFIRGNGSYTLLPGQQSPNI